VKKRRKGKNSLLFTMSFDLVEERNHTHVHFSLMAVGGEDVLS